MRSINTQFTMEQHPCWSRQRSPGGNGHVSLQTRKETSSRSGPGTNHMMRRIGKIQGFCVAYSACCFCQSVHAFLCWEEGLISGLRILRSCRLGMAVHLLFDLNHFWQMRFFLDSPPEGRCYTPSCQGKTDALRRLSERRCHILRRHCRKEKQMGEKLWT